MAAGLGATEVRSRLWIGSQETATQIKPLVLSGITHVLSVGTEFPSKLGLAPLDSEAQLQRRRVEGRSLNGRCYLQSGGKKDPFVRLFLPVEDIESEDIGQHFDECRLFITEGLAQGKVFMHCSDGHSRSVAMVLSFLVQREKTSVAQLLVGVREKMPSANPRVGFIDQLRSLEQRLGLPPASPRTTRAAGFVDKTQRQTANPQVFFEISIDGESKGRMVFELFADVVPETVENFRCICTGERGRGTSGKRLNYLGSVFHRIIAGVGCVGGDITMGNGTGGESIYGHMFKDENFEVKHTEPGMLSMANSGPDSNGSQFLISTASCPQLDGKNVAFGRIVSGLDALMLLEACSEEDGVPAQRILVLDCGEVAQPGRSVKRLRASKDGVAHVLHIVRKHCDVKKPTSWRQEQVSCTREEAAAHLAGLRSGLKRLASADLRSRFEELAAEHSDCKSAKKRGDLGPFERGMMQRSFEDASFALKAGELSEVISTRHGEHIILRVG